MLLERERQREFPKQWELVFFNKGEDGTVFPLLVVLV